MFDKSLNESALFKSPVVTQQQHLFQHDPRLSLIKY